MGANPALHHTLPLGPRKGRLPGVVRLLQLLRSDCKNRAGRGAWPRGGVPDHAPWSSGPMGAPPGAGTGPARRKAGAAQLLLPDLCVDAPRARARDAHGTRTGLSLGAGGVPACGAADAQCGPSAQESGTIGSRSAVPATPRHKSSLHLPLTGDRRAWFFVLFCFFGKARDRKRSIKTREEESCSFVLSLLVN